MSTPSQAPAPAQAPSARTQVKRISENARYDQDSLYAIVDEAYVCHVAFHDQSGSHCIPTACWREGDFLYIHGANASRLCKVLRDGVQACVAILHLDGLVLARAAFNHSMNYRSAMIYGSFSVVPEHEKAAAMIAFMDKIAPGRQAQVRAGNRAELAGTTLLKISLQESVCKTRQGGPNDDEDDLTLPVWAGVLPLQLKATPPIAADNTQEVGAPDYVQTWETRHA